MPRNCFDMCECDSDHDQIDRCSDHPCADCRTSCMSCPNSIDHFPNSFICVRHAHRRSPPHYHLIRPAKMDLRTFLMQSPDLSQGSCVEGFSAKWVAISVDAKTQIVGQEEVCADEFILLSGCLSSTICDPYGKEVCVGFFVGPCVVTPNIARTREGQSLVSIKATTDTQIARINSDLLTTLMIASE